MGVCHLPSTPHAYMHGAHVHGQCPRWDIHHITVLAVQLVGEKLEYTYTHSLACGNPLGVIQPQGNHKELFSLAGNLWNQGTDHSSSALISV